MPASDKAAALHDTVATSANGGNVSSKSSGAPQEERNAGERLAAVYSDTFLSRLDPTFWLEKGSEVSDINLYRCIGAKSWETRKGEQNLEQKFCQTAFVAFRRYSEGIELNDLTRTHQWLT